MVDELLGVVHGDMPAALAILKDRLPAAALQNVALAHSLAVWSDDHVSVVKALSSQADITSLRDVALRFNGECNDSHRVGGQPGEVRQNHPLRDSRGG